MIAVTACCGTDMDTSLIAAELPKYAVRLRVTMQGFALVVTALGSGTLMAGARTFTNLSRLSRNTSVDCSTEP
jgi:hypothetical protein